jgi:hypothetical protein
MKKAPCYVGITGGGLLCLSLGGDCNAVSCGSVGGGSAITTRMVANSPQSLWRKQRLTCRF